MKIIGKISILFVFVLIFISGCIQENIKINQSPEIEILNLTTDKTTYSSHEDMKILIIVRSSKNIENVIVKVYGIKPHNYAYINESKIVNFSQGENKIIFSAKTPYCTSGCGGVYPGPYNINAEILVNSKIFANSTTIINLVKG